MSNTNRTNNIKNRLVGAYNILRTGTPYGVRKRTSDNTMVQQVKKSPYSWPIGISGTPQWSMVDNEAFYEEGFANNSVIYASIMVKVRAMYQLNLVAASGTYENPSRLPGNADHPLVQILNRPNPYMSENQYLGLQTTYLNLTGNAFGYLSRPTPNSLPTEIWPLNPTWVQIIPDNSGGLKGYRYSPNGVFSDMTIPILPANMMHIKYPNPLDTLYGLGFGLSPMSSLARSADVDNQLTQFLKLFFQKGAMPTGILKLKDMTIDDDAVAEIKQRWMEVYGGSDNWTDVAVLDMMMDYQRVGLTMSEMDFEKIDERDESRMLLPFGVPAELLPIKLGLQGSTFANKEEARKWFWEDTMQYEMGIFLDSYQQYLSTDDGLFPIWDTSKVTAFNKNIPQLVTAAKDLWSMGVPPKIAFSAVGLSVEEYTGNDFSYVPLNAIPSKAPAVLDSDNIDVTVTPSSSTTNITPITEDLTKNNSRWTIETKDMLYKQFDNTAVNYEPTFLSIAKDAFSNDKKSVLAIVNDTKRKALEEKASVNYYDLQNAVINYIAGSNGNWNKMFAPALLSELKEVASFWSKELGVPFDVSDLESLQWFKDYTERFSNPIIYSTQKDIKDIFQKAITEGWSNDQLANVLGDTFEEWEGKRSEVIARTETARIANAGAINLFDRWGVKNKEWLATGDDRTRPYHQVMSGQVVPLNGKFTSGLGNEISYPGDHAAPANETIQCRCTVLPVTT